MIPELGEGAVIVALAAYVSVASALGARTPGRCSWTQKFIQDFGLTFPIGPDPRGRVSIDYGVYGVPETFFLDSQGRVRVKHVGAISDEVFCGHVDGLLAQPG
jgi:cytochrome c biogenesis protein CcmG, thiol:disulfide interchange protein DsbE